MEKSGLREENTNRVNVDNLRLIMQSSKGSVSSILQNKVARVPVNPSLVAKDVVSYGMDKGDQVRVSSLAGRPRAATSPSIKD
ncbi:hypothetical protein Tco_0331696 [Tanacetum coccineum]